MDHVDRLNIERDGLSKVGGMCINKKHLLINIRLKIKREAREGRYYKMVLVHTNDHYNLGEFMYEIDGVKVISDYNNISQGQFKLLN